MKYTMKERIDIGRQVFTQQITRGEAMTKYHIGATSVVKYIRLYKQHAGIPTKIKSPSPTTYQPVLTSEQFDIDRYREMSKEELIDELILAKANELRAKKGYEVKGVGTNKEFISLKTKNTK